MWGSNHSRSMNLSSWTISHQLIATGLCECLFVSSLRLHEFPLLGYGNIGLQQDFIALSCTISTNGVLPMQETTAFVRIIIIIGKTRPSSYVT